MKQYVFIDGYKIGLFRCPECLRGLTEDKYCMVHGKIDVPISVYSSEEAKITAIEIRINNKTEKITYEEFLIEKPKEELINTIINLEQDIDILNKHHDNIIKNLHTEEEMNNAYHEGVEDGKYR